MSFYKFNPEDLINSQILCYPSASVSNYGGTVTGSVYLERPFLMTALSQRVFSSFSPAAASILSASGPFTSSIEILDAVSGGLNNSLFRSINNLYRYYNFLNTSYTSSFTGSSVVRYRVIVVPEVYYDKQISTGTFFAEDYDISGTIRTLYDNGNGGIYSGSITGTLVGNIFYNEGIIVLKGGGFNDLANNNEFGTSSVSFLTKPPFGAMTNNNLPIASGLVAAYALNEGTGTIAYDSSGNGNNGTLSIVAPNAWITTGTYGTALLWSGSTTLLTTPSFTSSITSSFTIFTSFTPTLLSSSTGYVLNPAGSSTGQPQLNISLPSWDYQFHGVNPGPVTGTQQFLGMWLSSSSSDGIYINNTLNGPIVGQNNPPPYGPFDIGFNGIGLNGKFDFVYVWNRVLTSAEISLLNSNPFILYNTNLSWSMSFLGNNTIPVNIFRCRAPAGQLNASTNPTYFQIDNNTSSSLYPGEKQIVAPTNSPWITSIGIYDDHYQLVAIAKLAQPIKKDEAQDIMFKLHQDW